MQLFLLYGYISGVGIVGITLMGALGLFLILGKIGIIYVVFELLIAIIVGIHTFKLKKIIY